MSHSKKIQFYRNNTVVRPDTQNNKTAFTVAKEAFDNIENISDGEVVLVRYKEGDDDPVKTLGAIYHLNGNVGAWTYLQEELVSGDNIKTLGSEALLGSGNVTPTIPYAQVDSTSTSTAYTATVPGITELKDGVCCLLKNGKVTSAEGFTININNLGAKPSYSNMATGNAVTPTAPTRDTTIFNINYVMLFIYNSTIVEGGAWICYRGYDANTNTIGYQLRTNSTVMTVTDTARYYKIYFTSANGKQWVPATANSTKSATSAKPVNQRPIDPFGRIVYTSVTTSYVAGDNLAATTIWDQYNITFGYSFNRTGAALTLTTKQPVYIKCAPQSDGSAIIDSTTPYVQSLPTTNDGKIYIFLGIATSETQIELVPNHPVYYHDGTGIRLWTGKEIPNISDTPLVVTLTKNGSVYSADKTALEIKAVAEMGRQVFVNYIGQYYVMGSFSSTSTDIFAEFEEVSIEDHTIYGFSLSSVKDNNDEWTDTWTILELPMVTTEQMNLKADKIIIGTLTGQYDANEEFTGYTCNKTFAQLTAAFNASGIVLLRETDFDLGLLYLHDITNSEIIFYSQPDSGVDYVKITVNSDNTIDVEDMPFTYSCGDY